MNHIITISVNTTVAEDLGLGGFVLHSYWLPLLHSHMLYCLCMHTVITLSLMS